MSILSSWGSHLSYIDEPLVVVRSIRQAQSNLHPIIHQGAICIHKPLSQTSLFKDQTYITVRDIFITSYKDTTWNIDREDINLITICLSLEWLKNKLPIMLFNEVEKVLKFGLIITGVNFSAQEVQLLQRVALLKDEEKNNYNFISTLLEFFRRFYAEIKNIPQEPKSNDLQLLANLYDKYIANFYLEPPSIERMANEVGFSVSKLKKMFKETYGKPIYQSHIESKLTNALKMLEEGYSVKIVASQLGYTQPIKFIKAFQRHYGVTPGKLKRNKR
jgi:AraC-like DNA-binding protein